MKKLGLLLVFSLLLVACNKNPENQCPDYRQAMRDFVVRISETAKMQHADFIVIPQNGIELVTLGNDAESELAATYLAAIDGHGQEDLFYGYPDDELATPADETDYLLHFLHRSQACCKSIFVIDYCAQSDHVADSYNRCDAEGFVGFAAQRRNLDEIPTHGVHHENATDVTQLSQAKNFLYLINPEKFRSKEDFIAAVCATNYDILVMDLFFDGDDAFTAAEIERLRYKANGGKRLVISYMSIGEAEDYRYYWQPDWKRHRPAWMEKENRNWPGNYIVRYWYSDWQELICGRGDSYLNRILNAGFDGVYLDIVDGYEYFE